MSFERDSGVGLLDGSAKPVRKAVGFAPEVLAQDNEPSSSVPNQEPVVFNGANKPSPFGGGAAKPSPFGGGAAKPSPFGGGAAKPSPFGGGAAKPSPFGGGDSKPSPFGAAKPPVGAPPASAASSQGTPSVGMARIPSTFQGRGLQDVQRFRFRSVNFDCTSIETDKRTQSYLKELSMLDKNGDGEVSQEEFLSFIDDYVKKKLRNKYLSWGIGVLVIYALLSSLLVAGLAWAVLVLTKDTKASSGLFVDKSSGETLKTAATSINVTYASLGAADILDTYGISTGSASFNPALKSVPEELSTVKLYYKGSMPLAVSEKFCIGLKKAGQNKMSTTWADPDPAYANDVLDMLFQAETGCSAALASGQHRAFVAAFTDRSSSTDYLVDCGPEDDYCHVFLVDWTGVLTPNQAAEYQQQVAAAAVGTGVQRYQVLVNWVAIQSISGLLHIPSAITSYSPPGVPSLEQELEFIIQQKQTVGTFIVDLQSGGVDAYVKWAQNFGKAVAPQDVSTVNRQQTFQQALSKIQDINQQKLGWVADVTFFADMTNEEKAAYGGLILPDTSKPPPYARRRSRHLLQDAAVPIILSSAMPASFDWRSKKVITPVRDQGACGACWAFAGAAAMEAGAKIMGRNVPDSGYSIQQLIDCNGNPPVGCEGADVRQSLEYARDNIGVAPGSAYPYKLKATKCPRPSFWSKHNLVKVEHVVFTPSWSDELWDWVLGSEQTLQGLVWTRPTIVGIKLSPDLYNYGPKSGIYRSSDCDSQDMGHAMLAIGWGTDKTGQDYWILKNSWGTSWGIQGYMLFARNAKGDPSKPGMCNIGNNVAMPIFKGTPMVSSGAPSYPPAPAGERSVGSQTVSSSPPPAASSPPPIVNPPPSRINTTPPPKVNPSSPPPTSPPKGTTPPPPTRTSAQTDVRQTTSTGIRRGPPPPSPRKQG